jgi:hypothetical protein
MLAVLAGARLGASGVPAAREPVGAVPDRQSQVRQRPDVVDLVIHRRGLPGPRFSSPAPRRLAQPAGP